MSNSRSRVGLGGANQYLAAVGGRDRDGILRVFEKYYEQKNEWAMKEPMIIAREQAGVCCLENKLVYVFCGYHGNPEYSVERYDI